AAGRDLDRELAEITAPTERRELLVVGRRADLAGQEVDPGEQGDRVGRSLAGDRLLEEIARFIDAVRVLMIRGDERTGALDGSLSKRDDRSDEHHHREDDRHPAGL